MTPQKPSRRAFLSTSVLAGLGLATFGGAAVRKLAHATPITQTGEDRYYIFIYFNGGWDQLLALDPRDPGVFGNSTMATTGIQPGYEFTTAGATPYRDVLNNGSMYLGPFVGDAFAAKANRLAIVRGMSMDTLTHDVGRRRFLTGRPPSGVVARGSSTDTWLAAELGADNSIPNLALAMESYNKGDLPTYASALRAASFEDLLRALRAGDSEADLIERELDTMLRDAAACPGAAASPLLKRAEDARVKLGQMSRGNLDRLFDFTANTPEMVALRSRYGITGTTSAALSSSAARAALAATAIKGGVARVVSITINVGGLDHHFSTWATDHGPNLATAFNAVAHLISDLETTEYPDNTGDSWLDRTVIIGFSEFARTPLLNVNGGRDHWLSNSCFLAGGNIRGGQVIGASSNRNMMPLPINLVTGEVEVLDNERTIAHPIETDRIEIPKPEHILQTLYHELGLVDDERELRVKPLPNLIS